MIKRAQDVLMAEDVDELFRLDDEELSNFVAMVYCTQGSMRVHLYDNDHILSAGGLLVGMVIDMKKQYMRTPDFSAAAICFTLPFYHEIMFDCLRAEPNWLEKQQYVVRHPIISLDEHYRDIRDAYVRLIDLTYLGPDSPLRSKILHSIAISGMLEAVRLLDNYIDGAINIEVTQKDLILRKYLELLRNPENRKMPVAWYADQLNITPKYLSAVCKERSNKTASEWISEYTMDEIKRLLCHTDMTIKEIAFQMGFSDASFFCQYVKKHAGKTPVAIRKGR